MKTKTQNKKVQNNTAQSQVKLSWINPTSHYIYQGWMYFFSKHFNFTMFDEAFTDVSFGNHVKITHSFPLSFLGTGFNFINNKKKIMNTTKGGYTILGDFFTFDLPFFYLFDKKAVLYSEFFYRPLHEKLSRKFLFWFTTLPFRHKKIIVSSQKSYDAFNPLFKKTYYLKPFYHGDIHKNTALSDKKLKILVIGYFDDWKKNYSFVIDALNELYKTNKNFEFHIAGGSRNKSSLLEKIQFPYVNHGRLTHDQLTKLYTSCNVFIQASLVDPIGAVVLEAMAHNMPIICSKNVGAADYITDTCPQFDPLSKKDFLRCVEYYMNPKNRTRDGTKNGELAYINHSTKNKKLLKEQQDSLIRFFQC